MTKANAQRIIKVGNAKLSTAIGVWNITAGKAVCGMECKGCYAMKSQARFPSVLVSREDKLALSKTDVFVTLVIEAIRTLGLSVVRIHESGEFYSQEYLNKWTTIAEALPEVTFYTYTKREGDWDFSAFKGLTNVTVINSLQYGEINYGKGDHVINQQLKGAFACPATMGTATGCGFGATECNYCMTKQAQVTSVVFLQH